MPISYAILIILPFLIYLHVFKVSKTAVISKCRYSTKAVKLLQSRINIPKFINKPSGFISVLSCQTHNNVNRQKSDAEIPQKFYEKYVFQLLKMHLSLI